MGSVQMDWGPGEAIQDGFQEKGAFKPRATQTTVFAVFSERGIWSTKWPLLHALLKHPLNGHSQSCPALF